MSLSLHPGFPFRPCALPVLLLTVLLGAFFFPAQAASNGCTAKGCHAGIEAIVPQELPMMTLILQNGLRHRDMDGCVVCHGGNPEATDKEKAHQGIPPSLERAPGPKAFYANPGDLGIAADTCGVCHPGYVYRVQRSLMNTQAGKIRSILSAWGIRQDEAIWGNQETADPDGPVPSGTTEAYEVYVDALGKAFPGVFPRKLNRLPLPTIKEIAADPAKAAFIYLRKDCLKCHLNVPAEPVRGNFRGTGCAACHMRYAKNATYGGDDQSLPREQPAHVLSHRIAGNRKTGGIPVETCQACHNRGKRIGVSFAGYMESPFPGQFDSQGNPMPKTHGKHLLLVQEDLHHRTLSRPGNPKGGLLCQDCHTSMDVHGDGNLKGATLAQVEIECTDCHGTPEKRPWELPLGHGDEFGPAPLDRQARGTADARLLSSQQFGYDYDRMDGYLISARGNPLGNVVRKGNQVLVHSASGRDFFVPVLRDLPREEETAKGRIAMTIVPAHLKRLECYTCHAAWAPQIYGSRIQMDFSAGDDRGTDWVRVSVERPQGDRRFHPAPATLPVKIADTPVYQRWETPVLGINGEGRISPLMPGLQAMATVNGPDRRPLWENHLAENPAEAAAAGQPHIPLALDTLPVQPHTNSLGARPCESCHACPKTLGLGMGPLKTDPPLDWSRIVDIKDGQVATVGSLWPGSRALNAGERSKILKTGTCMGCHQFKDLAEEWKQVAQPKTPQAEDHLRIMETLMGHGLKKERPRPPAK